MGICTGNEKKMRRYTRTKDKHDENNKNSSQTTNQNSAFENSLASIKTDNNMKDNEYLPIKNNKTLKNQIKNPNYNFNSQNSSDLNEFMGKNKIQKSEYDNDDPNDPIFNEIKKFELEELTKEYESKIGVYNKVLTTYNLDLNLNNNLITNIVKNEDSKFIYKKKIIDKIKSIKDDDKKYKIDYLTILLVGRKGVGKTTLINYMLKIKENDDDNVDIITEENFISYHSKKVPHLKLVEFKGIGIDKNSEPETIVQKTIKYIQNHIKNKEKNNYNDFVHCIWYCVSGSRFEKSEIDVLKKLKQVYEDKNLMPIIVVYTQSIDNLLANKMNEYINKQGTETIFANVLAKDMEMMDDTIKKAFGEEELLNKTLVKCTTELKGEMINLMTSKISEDIKSNLITNNKEYEKIINNNIIKEFIEKYKYVLKDEEFINYLVNLFGKNLITFYENYTTKISNASLNLLNQSNFITSIKNYIPFYKSKAKEIIESMIKILSNYFLDMQATKEKENGNIKITKKRCLKGFNKTNEIFLKRNFYYYAQKYIINYIIINFCRKYFMEYRKQLDSYVKELFEQNKDEEINSYLVECFLTKLKNFADRIKIPFEINCEAPDFIDLPDKRQVNGEEELYKNDLNSNSFDLGINYNEPDDEDEIQPQIQNEYNNEENWFPLKEKKWKYLNNDACKQLNEFLQKIEYQDIYFNDKNIYDRVFNSLKEYIRNDLIYFFHSKKASLIRNSIDEKYKNTVMKFDKLPILKTMESENTSSIYIKKIQNEFYHIENDNDFSKIDYLSIIIVGQSGLGKSTLINCILKENLAKEGAGDIVTTVNQPYQSKNIPFLRLIDTRGIELNKEYGPNQIIKYTYNYINEQKVKADEEKNYNNYIQCIWYCVKGNDLEQKEIEIIKDLQKAQKSLPLIIVYTKALNKQEVFKMKDIIKEKLGDIPFIPVLGRSVEGGMKSYGLDNLLNKTLEVCKNAVKGEIFNIMKINIRENIINFFNKINKDIKIDINKNIVYKFIHEFNKVLNDKELIDFMFILLESIINEYTKIIKDNKELSLESKDNLKKSKNIILFIEEYIKYYKEITKNIVNPILEKKAIKYLDIQVKKEIKDFKTNIKTENKNNKKDFIKIIETFLNSNFYYISQKYIIYHLITDVSESFMEEVENQVNKNVKEILSSKEAQGWFENIYYKKFEDFKNKINKFRKNGNIYRSLNNKYDEIIKNENINDSGNPDGPKNLYPEI